MKNNSVYPPKRKQSAAGPSRGNFKDLEVSELYCPKCRAATPVNKFLLLILPDGDKYEYRCRFCGTNVGKKTDHSGQFYEILKGRTP